MRICSKIDVQICAQMFKQSIRKSSKIMKIHPKSVKIDQNGAKRVQNASKIHQRSILGSFWGVFGAKSRPGRLQEAPPRKKYSPFGRFLAENVAPRVDLSCLREIPAPGPRKVMVQAEICSPRGCWRQSAGDSRDRVPKNVIFWKCFFYRFCISSSSIF